MTSLDFPFSSPEQPQRDIHSVVMMNNRFAAKLIDSACVGHLFGRAPLAIAGEIVGRATARVASAIHGRGQSPRHYT
jgi:hypothetical protein